MIVYLDRIKYTPDGTEGELSDDSGDLQHVYTMEPPLSGVDHPCIPAGGPYHFNVYQSPKHGKTWICQDIPGRSNIELHSGNTWHDSLGCILVGSSLGAINGQPAVLDSHQTMKMLRDYLPDSFRLMVDAPL